MKNIIARIERLEQAMAGVTPSRHVSRDWLAYDPARGGLIGPPSTATPEQLLAFNELAKMRLSVPKLEPIEAAPVLESTA